MTYYKATRIDYLREPPAWQMTYFKATRPDGTDFRTGRIDYAAACGTGEVVRPLSHSSNARLCGPGYLHASDVAAETLVGGSWPCRLFEVEGEPVVGFNAEHPHKGGFTELRVLRELPAHLALGPNGEQVAALIERAGRLTAEEAEALSAVWSAAWSAARSARSARSVARSALSAERSARSAERTAAWSAARSARSVAETAAAALVVRDVLDPEHFDTLYGPWRDVIGEPA